MTLEELLGNLVGRGWVARDGGGLRLTPEGLGAQSAAEERVAGLRRTMSAGLAEGDYAATVDVLANMAANLERD